MFLILEHHRETNQRAGILLADLEVQFWPILRPVTLAALPDACIAGRPVAATDARQFSPSAARNCVPIREVLIRVLPKKGIALEIGSGTGEHVISFAKALPGLVWLPSDPDEASRASIRAWSVTEGLANVRAPVSVDVRDEIWGVEDDAPFDAMISLNMVHIAPWEAALALLAGAGRLSRWAPRVLRALYAGRDTHGSVQRRFRR